MTDKQKLAIKRLELNKNIEIYVDYKNKEKTDDIQVVLDLLKEKDRQIDLMSEYISEHTDCPCENEGKDLDCEKMCDVRIDRDCWKIYFENKVKEKNND
ncbi:MAG: hypothetical protein MR691_08580 [Clostridium sp.]|nr:hypothetical protein [Clostridium sp.]